MSGISGNNSFRKDLCEEAQLTKIDRFRKSIDMRVSTPLKENHLERSPHYDILFKHKK